MRRRNALTIRILLATAVRSAELYIAKWEHIDLAEARWHIPKSKTGTAMDIPLAPIVLGWFKELREMAGASAYVLPAHSRGRAARQGGDTHVSKDTIREAIGYWLDAEKPAEVPHVLGLANWSTIDGVNYAHRCAVADPGLGLRRAALGIPRHGHALERHRDGAVRSCGGGVLALGGDRARRPAYSSGLEC